MERMTNTSRSTSDGVQLLDNGSALLLPIRRQHADRIFDGSKHYELRKILPRLLPRRVYLYEVGGGGVVGSFEVGGVIRTDPDELWSRVGNAAATLQRFH